MAAAEHEPEPACGCFGTSPPKSPPGSPRGPHQNHQQRQQQLQDQLQQQLTAGALKPERLNRSFSSMYIAEGAMAIVHACVMLSDGSVVTTTEGTAMKVWSEGGAAIHELHVRRKHSPPLLSIRFPSPFLAEAKPLSLRPHAQSFDSSLSTLIHSAQPPHIPSPAPSPLLSPLPSSPQGHSDKVWCLGVAEDDLVVSASWDGSLIVWDAKRGEIVHELHGHTDKARGRRGPAVARSAQLRCAASAESSCRPLSLYLSVPLSPIVCIRRLTALSAQVWGMVILNATTVISASFDKTLRVWDIRDGTCKMELRGHTDKARNPDSFQRVRRIYNRSVRPTDAAAGGVQPDPGGRSFSAPIFRRRRCGRSPRLGGPALCPGRWTATSACGT